MDCGVLLRFFLRINYGSVVSETHVKLSEVNPDCKGANFNPRFLQEVCEQVPDLLSKNACPQLVLIYNVKSERSVNKYGGHDD